MKKIIALLLALLLVCAALPAMAAEKTVFKFNAEKNVVFLGRTAQLEVIRSGAAQEGEVTFTSANEKRATVDANGVVTGLAKGQVSITAQAKSGGKNYKATITVTVATPAEEVNVVENNLTVYAPEDPFVQTLMAADVEEEIAQLPVLVLRKGVQTTINAVVLPKETNNRRIAVSVTDETVAKVKNGNILVPQDAGECVLTVASVQNPEVVQRYRLLVVQPVTQVKLDAQGKAIYVGEQLQLNVSCMPDNATIKDVTWSSANEKIAVVDENGVVTGKSKGQVYIKATAVDGSGRNAAYQVTVKQQPESITLKESSMIVNVGRYRTMTATVLPNTTNDKSVVWSTSDAKVATVNSRGQVTGVAPGVCTITCTSKEFAKVYATAMVEVRQPVTKVAFTDTEISFNVNDTCQLFWQISPANASVKDVTFKTNNSSIATVDQNGVVTGHKRGTCTITVTAADGSEKRDTIKVNVLQPVWGVHMENDTLRVGVEESITARAVLEPSDASDTRMTWTSADKTIATVKGSKNRPTITGKRWGTTTITGVTNDGGYTTTATINVGNYDKALKITDLYLSGNKIKIVVNNESNMTVTRFSFVIECYDIYDNPLACNAYGSHAFYGSYRLALYEGDSTQHGRFYFDDYVQPDEHIGRVVMRLTGYSTDTGYSRDIKTKNQPTMEFKSANFVGATPTPVPEVTPPSQENP